MLASPQSVDKALSHQRQPPREQMRSSTDAALIEGPAALTHSRSLRRCNRAPPSGASSFRGSGVLIKRRDAHQRMHDERPAHAAYDHQPQ